MESPMKYESDCNVTNEHYNDKHISFEPIEHIYEIKNSSDGVVSVTTFIHSFFKPFDKYKMANICSKCKSGEYSGKSVNNILTTWDDIREMGSRKHAAMDKFLTGKEYDDIQPPNSFFKFLEDHPGLTPYRTEWSIFDEETRIAGQVDALFTKEDGKIVLADWKNTKEIRKNGFGNKKGINQLTKHLPDCNFSHYSLQLNIYRHIIEKNYGIDIDSMLIVNFPPSKADEGIYEKFIVEKIDIEEYFNTKNIK